MKYLKAKLFFAFLLLGFSSVFGQFTDVINSNKPGFSESPYSVGTGVYQFESSLFYRNTGIEPTFTIPQSLGIDFLFRTSFFFEKLELNTQISYQKDKIAFKNIFSSDYSTSGLSKLTVGAKYLVFQQEYKDKNKEVRSWKRKMAFDKKRLIPSVAVYVGLNTDFVNDIYKTQKMTPKFGLLLQNNLSEDLNIITNLYYDKMGTDFTEFSYIVTATQNFSDRWSAFIENQGIFQKQKTESNIGLGLAYLFSKDLQINTSGRMLFEGKSSGLYAGLGVSGYYIYANHVEVKSLRAEYNARIDEGISFKDTEYAQFDNNAILTIHDQYQTWRDVSILSFSLIYLFNVLDAAVEGHFANFDISNDLSLEIKPSYQARQNAFGIGLALHIK